MWREINNFPYSVNELGEIKNNINNKIRKKSVTKYGYEKITLYNYGVSKTFLVHRLVAQAFIPNISNYDEVNHKDENKLNNNVSNLEWCTSKYNMNYGTRNLRAGNNISKALKGKISGKNNPFYNHHHTEESIKKMSDSKLGKVLSAETVEKMRIAHKGKQFTNEHKEKIAKALSKPIIQLDENNNLIKYWESATQVSKTLGFDKSSIIRCCKSKQKLCGGYKWEYVINNQIA